MTTQPSHEAPLKDESISDAATDTSAEEGQAGLQQGKGCECATDNAGARFAWMLWVAPSVLFAGLCIHSVFEGLAVGLQVGLSVSWPRLLSTPVRGSGCLTLQSAALSTECTADKCEVHQ